MGKNIAEVLSILVKAIENNGEGKIADPLHFETEEAGLAHCQKLATLKPGDVFFSKAKDSPARKNVFMGFSDEGMRVHGLFLGSDKELYSGFYPVAAIRFAAEESPTAAE